MIKVNILSSTAFHVLPLAYELQKQGLDVRFYSYLPHSKTKKANLKKGSAVSMLWLVSPLLVITKLFPAKKLTYLKMIHRIIDAYCCRFMRSADIVIALGSVYLDVLHKAKKSGAITILEWGSKHSIEQRKSFGIPMSLNVDTLKRELDAFEIADYIAIPSVQVATSFTKHGIPSSKLLINPYGTDISQFPPTVCEENAFDLISIGGWRYEKGSDLLIELCTQYGFSLLHVGGLVNMSFPQVEHMKHIDPVPQSKLTDYYKKAKVFVLPSRAEGLSLVQIQAIGSGLPIVCSKETGGRDLKELIDDPKWIIEMEELTVTELKQCVDIALELAYTQKGFRKYSEMGKLTWDAYGKRYYNNLLSIYK